MLEFILSKLILIVFSLAVLLASGSIVSSFYAEQEKDVAAASFQQIVDMVRQADSYGGEFTIKLDMSRYLDSESFLQIGDGSMYLQYNGKVFFAELASCGQLNLLGDDGLGTNTIKVAQGDILVIGRVWDDIDLRTVIYIENVEATFSTAFTNRSASSMVL